jgi:hypothetical protein
MSNVPQESQDAAPPNKHMLRAGTPKVRGRGRTALVLEQVMRARVLLAQRAGADAGR